MAQEISDIYDGYWQELQNQPTLNNLNPQIDDQQTLLSDLGTPSKVAEHRLWIWLFSVFSWMQQVIFDRHQEEVEEIVAQNAYGHLRWWVEKMKGYQHGSALIFDSNNRPGYQTVIPEERIIAKAAAISQGGGNVLLKAAKLDGSGIAVALDTPTPDGELQGLKNYCSMIAPAGINVNVLSLNADKLRITAEVKCDPSVFNITDGSLITTPSTYPVIEAINEYLAEIPFNGQLSLTHLKDKVQLVPGVNDFVISSAIGIQGNNLTTITRLYSTVAGYIVEDDSVGNTFSDLITYSSGD